MKVNILRRQTPDKEPYWESFTYDGPEDNTVAGLIEHINYNDDIINDKGEKTGRIGWECSCIQGICGACAMVVNDKPVLACEAFLKDLEGEEINIRPLSNFPVVHDLIVDRSGIHENLKQNDVFIGEYQPSEDKDHEQNYASAKCLKCGLCIEVCPKYSDGRVFFGAPFAVDCYLAAERNREKAPEIAGIYQEHFKSDCGFDLACMKICPMGISITTAMKKLNSLSAENTKTDKQQRKGEVTA